ncbi:MAG TPA: c-type cytochrome [Chloroflexota bacterium]|nr:c-type cytochrome [Chloroflexota bacterium]
MRLDEAPATTIEARAAARRPQFGPFLVGLGLGLLGAMVLGIVVGGPLIVAKRTDVPFERTYGNFAVSLAARIFGGNAPNPVAQNARALVAGRDAYTGSCASCHGAAGDGRGVFGISSYPNATDLTSHDATEKSDAETFWIIKNGLSFTGMPGFADQYSDQDLWSLVTYVRALQNPSGAAAGNQVQFGPIQVPAPTPDQVNRADPTSSDPAARGAALYFAQGCDLCHGAGGDAPGNMRLARGSPEAVRAIRQGRPGMPAYNQALLSDSELADLQAYVATIGSTQSGEGGAGEGDRRPAGGSPGGGRRTTPPQPAGQP